MHSNIRRSHVRDGSENPGSFSVSTYREMAQPDAVRKIATLATHCRFGFLFFLFYFIYLFIFGCVGSSFLCESFL